VVFALVVPSCSVVVRPPRLNPGRYPACPKLNVTLGRLLEPYEVSSSTPRAGSMRKPFFEIRSSPIHGHGAFATRRIRKGTRIIEYTGERLAPLTADARYDDDRSEHPHILLFTVDRRTVIDAGVGGNEARYFNHSCEPNCEAVIEQRRVYLEALRTIAAGEELTYDYQLERGRWPPAEWERRYACRCGAATCRGTMLAPPPRRKPRSGRKAAKKHGAG
jgi:hypothetical protein